MQINTPLTGPDAISHALSKLDLDKLRDHHFKIVKSGARSKRTKSVQALNAIEGLKRNGVSPASLLIQNVPVIPAAFRPFSTIGNSFVPGAANELYRDLFQYKDMHEETRNLLGDAGSSQAKLDLYDTVKALYGYGTPIAPKTKQRGVAGFIGMVTGSNPKYSFVQYKLLSKPQDSVARGTIAVDPELSLDEIGVPKDMAWTMYAPYIQRRLVQNGLSASEALLNVRDRTDFASKALDTEIKSRPVIYSRAPSWHKFNVISGRPRLIDGHTIMLNPLVTTGLNADFDGDRNLNKVYVLLTNDYLLSASTELTNKLVFLQEKEECKIPQKDLALPSVSLHNGNTVMTNKIKIPTYNKETHTLYLVDLEDFPHGDLVIQNRNKVSDISVYMPAPDTQVIVYDESTGETKWADVACWSKHEGAETEIVTLHNDTQIITDDDPRAVYGLPIDSTDMQMERTTPTLALSRAFVVPSSEKIKNVISNLNNPIKEIPFPNFPGNGRMPLNWDTGYLMGVLAGDGWWSKTSNKIMESQGSYLNWGIHLADLKGFNANKLSEILIKYFGESEIKIFSKEFLRTSDNGRYGDTVKYSYYSIKYAESICRFLSSHLGGENGENHTGSGSKRLPSFAYTATEEFRRGLLCGLIDTDGSISVSNAKNVPQLLISFGSTSSRLIRDVQLLCSTLNIKSTITFSQITSKGNSAWILNLSTIDSKSSGVFTSLQCIWKRDNFINTSVDSNSESSAAQDLVPMPKCIIDILASEIGAPKLTEADKNSPGPESERKKRQQSFACIFTKARKINTASRISAFNMIELLNELINERKAHNSRALKWLSKASATISVTAEDVYMLREAILNSAPKYASDELYNSGKRIYASLNRPLKEGKLPFSTIKNLINFLTTNGVFTKITAPVFNKWLQIVNNKNVTWCRVARVEKTGIKEDGYDLTVPGYETFMSADGIILSNTMNLHVPSQDEAVEEAKEKLMPSKMLFSIKNREQVVPLPKQELILGLYTANKRPAKNTHSFGSEDEALAAIKQGQISLSDEIEIVNPVKAL